LLQPKFHFFFVAFAGLLGGTLQTPVHGTENLPDMTRVIAHSGQALDDRGDARQRPQVRAETVRPCAPAQRFVNLPQLRRSQLRFAASATRAAQCRSSTALPLPIPTRHTLTAHFQLAGDGGEDQLAGSKQTGCLFATALQTLKIPAERYGHTDSISENGSNVTLLRESVTVLCESL
jgi:hypothetical protein